MLYEHIVPVLDVVKLQLADPFVSQFWHHCATIDVDVPLYTPVYVFVHPFVTVALASLIVPSAVFQPTNVYPLRVGAAGNVKLPPYVQLPLVIELPLFSFQSNVMLLPLHDVDVLHEPVLYPLLQPVHVVELLL